MNIRNRRIVGATLVAAMFLAGCGLASGEPAPAGTPTATPTVGAPLEDATPVPAAPVFAGPTATPAPVTERDERGVENLVWLRVRECADRLSNLMGVGISVDFDSDYGAEEGTWTVEAFSRDPSISLGRWQVSDATGEVQPFDRLAASIADPMLNCQPPVAVLATDNTPPHFAVPTPTPTPGPTSVLNPPAPTPPPSLPGGTPPAGRDGPTPTPGPAPTPTPTPVPLTEDQAALRVWMATYECYSPPLESSIFTSRSIGPQHSLVEGRSQGDNVRLYGLWLVNNVTGDITAWDRTARSDMSLPCFKRP